MKKVLCAILALLLLPVCAAAAFSSTDEAQGLIDGYMQSLPLDEEEDTIYPEYFGGMYVDGENNIVVCLTDDSDANKQEYIDYFGSDENISFQKVERPYSLLEQYYITIGAKHVSTQYVIINLYKTKRYEINVEQNRVDIYMFAEEDTLEEVLEYMDSQGFGEGIYIYFVDENDTEVLTNEDEVYATKAEREANATPTPEATPTPGIGEQLEEGGLTFNQVGIPIIIAAVLVGAWFAISKLRSKNKDLNEEDDFTDDFK